MAGRPRRNKLLALAYDKGWTVTSLSRRWGVSRVQIYNLVKCPTVRTKDAFMGLPERVDV